MKQNILKLLSFHLITLTSIFITTSLVAQVTIGSEVPPEKAALLEIKSQKADASSDYITSTKGGLGLPRVKLVDPETLEPFIQKADDAWSESNQSETKIKHTGLMVYNVGTSNGFLQDVYIWNGNTWVSMGGGGPQRYFYIPSFNIPLGTVGALVTTDLYAEYESQFKGLKGTFVSSNSALTAIPAKADGSIYKREELDYVVTYYDTDVVDFIHIDDGSIVAADRGKLYLIPKKLDTSPNSFINIVFVIK